MTSYVRARYDSGETDPQRGGGGPAVSERSRGVALALGFIGGVFGLHRFYTGKIKSGLLMICTFGGLGLWWLYDMILLATGEFRDADDLPLRNWNVQEPRGMARAADRRTDELEERLDALQGEVAEMQERLDFTERMLAQQRDRDRLSKG
ncbi:MAG: NINE protein [Gemmatimonadales bacterium]